MRNNGMYEYLDGSRERRINGERHCEDGPALEYADGSREWWINDRLHRLDGPAYEGADGSHEWWIHGIEYTEEEFEQELRIRKWRLSVDCLA